MTDAYESGNPQVEGQPIDNVGQDKGQNVSESSNQNLEEQVKYFQSEKDKLANENPQVKAIELKKIYEKNGGTSFKERLKNLIENENL